MRVTVCIPTISKRSDKLAKAVESVKQQTYKDIDILVKEDTIGVGPAVIRNQMINEVETEFIAWLDDDDYMFPDHISTLVNEADRTGADLVYPWFETNGTDPFPQFEGRPWDSDRPHLFPITYLIRTSVAKESGGFPVPDYHTMLTHAGEDTKYIYKLNAMGIKIVHIPQRTWFWNHHDSNTAGLPSRAGFKRYPNFAVIPVKNRLDLTKNLVEQLLRQAALDTVIIIDNGSTDGTHEYLKSLSPEKVAVIQSPDKTIYQMWNEGWQYCKDRAEISNIAFLNNDIVISDDFIYQLSTALRNDPALWAVYPNYDNKPGDGVVTTTGTYRNGGMSGFAFMLKGEIPLQFDERFKWWYGDDDIVFKIQKSGYKVGRVMAVPLQHIGSASIGQNDKLKEYISNDKRLWAALGRD